MPTDTPVCPVPPERIAAFEVSAMASARASAVPLPGAANAFIKGAIKAGEYQVRKVVLADWKIWELIDSPFLRLFLEMQKPPDKQEAVAFTDDEEAMICFQMTRPVREVETAIRASGKETVQSVAKDEFFYGDGSESKQAVIIAANEQFQRHILTRLKYLTEQKDSGEIDFFRQSAVTD